MRVRVLMGCGAYLLPVLVVAALAAAWRPGAAASPATPSATPRSLRAFPDTTSGVHVFHDQLDFSALSSAQVRFAATHYAGAQKLLRSNARLIRTYNPNFIVLHYRLGEFLGRGTTKIIDGNDWVLEWPGESVVQPSWYFTNGAGPYVFDRFAYLMNLSSSGYQNWWSSLVEQQLIDNEDDGLFIDSFSVPEFFGRS